MLETLNFRSRALNGFSFAGTAKRSVLVYLPPNYRSNRQEPYPVIYLLAGWPSRGAKFLNDESAFVKPLHERLDEAVLKEDCAPAILVFPDGTTKMGGSQYINSSSTGHFQDYIADEIVDLVDRHYNTHAHPQYRGIMGHSSGGYGALMMGAFRPDRFLHILSSAADSNFELLFKPMINSTIIEIEKAGSIKKFIRDFETSPNPSSLGGKKFETMLMLSMASCFSPNKRQKEIGGNLFFDLNDGSILTNIWKDWLRWDPIHILEKKCKNLKKLKSLRLEAGAYDEYALQLGHRQISKALKKLKVPHMIEEFSGGHGAQNWRFDSRIKKMLRSMVLSK